MSERYTIDLHVHCRQGHGESLVDAAEIANIAKELGLSGLCLCPLADPDHLRSCLGPNPSPQTVVEYLRQGYDAGKKAAAEFGEAGPEIYFGFQYRIPRTADDVLVLGLDPEALLGIDLCNVDPWDLRRYVVDRGGLLVASHPFRQRNHGAPFGGANMFDAVEVFNGRRGEKNRNDLAAAWCRKIDAVAVVGSGSRKREELGEAVIELAELPRGNPALGRLLKRHPPLRILRRHDLRLGLQSCRFNGLFVEDELRHTERQGLEAFEIFFDQFAPEDIDEKARTRFRGMAESMGVELSVLAPVTPLTGPEARDRCQALMTFSHEVGAGLLVVPALSIIHDPGAIASCALRARSQGLRLAISNGPDPQGLVDPDTLLRLLAQVPGAQAALDIGAAHLHNNGLRYCRDLLDGLQKTGLRLVHLQLHDNNGDEDSHLSMGEGNVPFVEMLRLIFEAGFDGLGIIAHWREVRREASQISALVRALPRPWRSVEATK